MGHASPMKSSARIPVFYINLASRPDRREFMEAQFARLGVTAERVEAVSIDDVPQHLIEAQLAPGRPWRIMPGDLACGLSHQRIWTSIVERGLECALVLEDDALLAPTLIDFLSPGLLQHAAADIVRLETWASRAILGTRPVQVGTSVVRELASAQFGSAAYIIGRDAAAASLATAARDDMAVDRFLFRRGGFHLLRSRVYQAVPGAAVQLFRSGTQNMASRSDLEAVRPSTTSNDKVSLARSFQLKLDHAIRVVGLVLRDPAIVRERRTAIPFAGALGTADAGNPT